MFRAARHFIQSLRSVKIVGDKNAAILAYRDMIDDQIQRVKSKKNELNRLTNDIVDLEKNCYGAQLMAQEVIQRKKKEIEVRGITEAEAKSELQTIEDDEEFNYCWGHYIRIKEAIETKKKLIPVLEQEIQDLENKIIHHEEMLATMEPLRSITVTEEKIGESGC